MAHNAVSDAKTVTGGGAAVDWPFGWAYAVANSSASSLLLTFSVDGGTVYNTAPSADGSAMTAVSAAGVTVVLLPTGCKVKATGTGAFSLVPGYAPIQGYPVFTGYA